MRGVAQMRRSRFVLYDVGGGVLWVAGLITIGYFFGNLPLVKAHFEKVIWAMILIPGMLVFVGAMRARRRSVLTRVA